MGREKLPELSEKERAILQLALQGKRDKEIAAAMNMSVVTVRYHWQRVEAKARARTRLQAVYLLCCDGQLMPEGRGRMRLPPLSRKEKRLLCLAAEGLKDEEIARELGISLSTVRHYWLRVLAKTSAWSRVHAIYLLCCDGQMGEEGNPAG
jgi:DNA-binding CsgD family transcriptional regulator